MGIAGDVHLEGDCDDDHAGGKDKVDQVGREVGNPAITKCALRQG